MITKMLRADETAEAAELLRSGEIVGIPTETVYGLGGDAGNEDAVRAIFAAKGRPADNPLIVHIADLADWASLVTDIPPLAAALAKRFWPGPLTMILPRSRKIPEITAGGLDTVGVRFPAHPHRPATVRAAQVPPPRHTCSRTWTGASRQSLTAAVASAAWNPPSFPSTTAERSVFCGRDSSHPNSSEPLHRR